MRCRYWLGDAEIVIFPDGRSAAGARRGVGGQVSADRYDTYLHATQPTFMRITGVLTSAIIANQSIKPSALMTVDSSVVDDSFTDLHHSHFWA